MATQRLEPIKLSCYQQFHNPPGKGSSYLAPRHVISEGMKKKYAFLMKKYRREFKVWAYRYDNRDVMFHVQVPSQDFEHNKIRYDSLFYIPYGAGTNAVNNPLDRKPCLFWTNSPSFIYTYAYVYNQRGVMYRDFDEKIPDLCLTTVPVVRNNLLSLGYDFGLWQALAYLYSINAFSPRVFEQIVIPANEFNQAILRRRINDVATLLSIHKLAKYEQAKKHRVKMSPTEEVLSKTRRDNYNKNQQKYGKIIKPKKSIGAIKARKAVKSLLNKR